MRELATALGGIGLLIFAYLLLKNATGATSVLTGLSTAMTSTIKTLQGNG